MDRIGPRLSGRGWKWLAAVTGSALLLTVGVHGQKDEGDRERVERVADILTALGARDGAHIADLG